MKHWMLVMMAVCCFAASSHAQATRKAGNFQTFVLTASPPPIPAMKYAFLVDPSQRIHGNAAVLYLKAALQTGEDTENALDNAIDGDQTPPVFDKAAEAVYQNNKGVFDLLASAAACDQCDWQTTFNESGIQAALPQLGRTRLLSNLIRLRALQQIRQGKCDDAIATLQLGYELSHKIGQEQFLISAQVAIGSTAAMNSVLTELMNRPECPNLYWALATLPRPMFSLRHAMDGERVFQLNGLPAAYKFMYGGQFRIVSDDMYKIWDLPYPSLLPQLRKLSEQAAQRKAAGNSTILFDIVEPSLARTAVTFARLDRDVAALTAVEAIRSYAAANKGALPPTLADVSDTPVPDNPVTGKPFAYQVDGTTATLSDSDSLEVPLRYTIQSRP